MMIKRFLFLIVVLISSFILMACEESEESAESFYTSEEFLSSIESESTEQSTIIEGSISSESYNKPIKEKITITFDSDGGSVVESQEIDKGALISIPTPPKKQDMSFLGWYFNDEIWDFSKSASENMSLIAKWETYQPLSFDLDGGYFENEINYYLSSQGLSIPTPKKDGFYFLGWTRNEENEIYSTATIEKGTTGEVSFTAHWSLFEYQFNDDGTAIVCSYSFSKSVSNVKIPDTIRCNEKNYSVIGLGEGLFSGIGTMLSNKEIIVNNKIAYKFNVVIPKTLKTIDKNAFFDCNNVAIQVKSNNATELNNWADTLEIASGNDDVLDVIKGRRPAIGWSLYG